MYFDGTWSQPDEPAVSIQPNEPPSSPSTSKFVKPNVVPSPTTLPARPASTPSKRYIGAFGVAGWATRSGVGLIHHEEKVGIERAKPTQQSKQGKGGRARPMNKRQDIVVRFTNSKGEEIGRLENEAAAWVSTLLDQRVCSFEANCVYVPDRIRTMTQYISSCDAIS